MTTALQQDVRGLIDQERERFGVPGCAVLVVHDGEVVLRDGFGLRDIARELPVTPATLFPIGSSTKTFTAALCALAADEGLIGWDDPVAAYLPGFGLKDPVATQGLSLRDMLSHRSGLPRHDLLWYAASDGSLTRDDVLRLLRHLEPNRGFRQSWQYNNLLFMAAGELAARLFGCSYEEAVRKTLLDPLGMTRTGFRVAALEQDDDVSRPYVVVDEAAGPTEVPFASLDLIGPAGNINSCVDELTGWVLELLGRPASEGQPVLSDAVLDRLRTPVIPLSEVSPMTVGRSVGYAAGVAVDEYRGFRVFHHGGNIDGFSSQVAVLPETGSAVVVLCNRSSSGLRDALPYVLFDRLLGLEPRDHGAALWEKEQLLKAAMPGARPMTEVRPDRPAIRPLSEYVGLYRNAGYGDLSVFDDGGTPRLRYRTIEAVLVHQQFEVFDAEASLGGEERHLPAQFSHDLGGEVSALSLTLDPTAAAVRFERVPDPVSEELLEQAVGEYALGPVTLTVARKGAGLTVQIEQMAATEITPAGGNRFTVRGLIVEFLPPDTVKTPYGEFVRVPAKPS